MKKEKMKRQKINPNDKWSDLYPPLTEEQLAADRKAQHVLNDFVNEESYTCDTCEARYICPLVFDGYNTDGDCLMSK